MADKNSISCVDENKYYGINNSKLTVLGKSNALIEIDNKIFGVNLLIVPNETMVTDLIIG